MSRDGLDDIAFFSDLLGQALRNEDYDAFLNIYDRVIPKNLPADQLEHIKEKARVVAERLDYDGDSITSALRRSINVPEAITENAGDITIMDSHMTDSLSLTFDESDASHSSESATDKDKSSISQESPDDRKDDRCGAAFDYVIPPGVSSNLISTKDCAGKNANLHYDKSLSVCSMPSQVESPRVKMCGKVQDDAPESLDDRNSKGDGSGAAFDYCIQPGISPDLISTKGCAGKYYANLHYDESLSVCSTPSQIGSPTVKMRGEAWDEAHTPDSSFNSRSSRVKMRGEAWDEAHIPDSSFNSPRGYLSEDESQVNDTWSRPAAVPGTRAGYFHMAYDYESQISKAASYRNGDCQHSENASSANSSGLSSKLPVYSSRASVEVPRDRAWPSVAVDQPLGLPLLPRNCAGTKDSVPTKRKDGLPESYVKVDELSEDRAIQKAMSSGQASKERAKRRNELSSSPPVATSFLPAEYECDVNGNVDSAYLTRLISKNRIASSELRSSSVKDSELQPRRRGRKSHKAKENVLESQHVLGYRGNLPMEDVLKYVNGNSSGTDAVHVTGGESRQRNKAKKKRGKAKKTSADACHSCNGPLSLPSSGCSSTDAASARHNGNSAVVSPTSSTSVDLPAAAGDGATDHSEEEQHKDSFHCAVEYETAYMPTAGNDSVNVSTTVTTCETFSVDLVVEVPPPGLAERAPASCAKLESSDCISIPHSMDSHTLPKTDQVCESFLTVSKRKKTKDATILFKDPVNVNHTRPTAASSTFQVGFRSAHPAGSATCIVQATGMQATGEHASVVLPKDATQVDTEQNPLTALNFPALQSMENDVGCIKDMESADLDKNYFSQKRTWANIASSSASTALATGEPERNQQLGEVSGSEQIVAPDKQMSERACHGARCAYASEGNGAPEICFLGPADVESKSVAPFAHPGHALAEAQCLPVPGTVSSHEDVLHDFPRHSLCLAVGDSAKKCVRGVEFCGAMANISCTPFTISFGWDDSDVSNAAVQPLIGIHVQQHKPRDIFPGLVSLTSSTSPEVKQALNPSDTSPMAEARQRTLSQEELCSVRNVQFLMAEWNAVITLHRTKPGSTVVYDGL